jgi:tagatose 6-phosphate kinase
LKVNQAGPAISRREWAEIEGQLANSMDGRLWVVLSGTLPPGAPADAYARLARSAHRAGARVLIDCEGPPLARALRAKPDVVKLNRHELAATLETRCANPAAVLRAARELSSRGAKTVIVTDGRKPLLAVSPEGAWRATPPDVEQSSPMGAGDSLAAGLVAALAAGAPLTEALRLGAACGAACAAEPDTVLAQRARIRRLAPQVRIETLA